MTLFWLSLWVKAGHTMMASPIMNWSLMLYVLTSWWNWYHIGLTTGVPLSFACLNGQS